MVAIILAGDESHRMGRNEAFLIFQGRIFLWMIVETLTPLFDDLILVTREALAIFGIPGHGGSKPFFGTGTAERGCSMIGGDQ